jgi:DNA-binding protein WhiA
LLAVPASDCCRFAEGYGLLLFARVFSQHEISVVTENAGVAARAAELLKAHVRGAKNVFSVTADKINSHRQWEQFGHHAGRLILRINRANLENECCAGAFLRGAFLSSGTLTSPEKGYRLEFSAAHRYLAGDLAVLLREQDRVPHLSARKNTFTVYLHDSEQIEDLLTLMGAANSALELMNAEIYKDFRNVTNRRVNAETANISKTVNAAARQIRAIRALEASGELNGLPSELRETARLRVENPELTLAELARIAGISRSGLNRRLQKLVELETENKNVPEK